MSSKFIVIEGLEGAGKTSAIKEVANVLHQQNIRDIVFTREPGGTPLAEALRVLIKDGIGDEPVIDYAELLMLYAARVQLVEGVIKPALAKGTWVISDRYDLSTQAYQGGGRCIDLRLLQMLYSSVIGEFYPDLTLYLDISPTMGLARARTRNKLDRIEVETIAFFERTRARYQALAAENKHILTIDASQPLNTVNNTIHTYLKQWIQSQAPLL